MSKANEPAFPTAGIQNNEESRPVGGLTKLEYFAGLAMQGQLANSLILEQHGFTSDSIARYAVEQARALIAELEKQK